MSNKQKSITIKDVALMGILLSVVEVSKLALGFVPGVETVTLLFILYTLFLEKKVLYILPAFYLIEGVMYGFGIWWFMYVYIWALLVLLTYLFRKRRSVWFWSVFSGLFGLMFGLLCCPVYLAVGGIQTAVAWWIAGIYTDIIHGVSNFILCMILFVPLKKILSVVF